MNIISTRYIAVPPPPVPLHEYCLQLTDDERLAFIYLLRVSALHAVNTTLHDALLTMLGVKL